MKPKNNKQVDQSINKSNKKSSGFRKSLSIIKNLFLFIIAVGFIGGFFAVGIGAGYFASLVKDEPIRDYESMKKDLYNYEKTSKLYFAGNTYFSDIRSDIHREKISLDKVPKYLKDAVLATEDEDFYEHNGIEPKAIMRATLQEVTNSDVRTGGSTLTQQLIKNQILTNEVSFDRKAKEILIALRVENFFSKDEILQAYLNVIPYGREASGRNIAGIKTAANGIFGIEPEKLNLSQAAYLAGLPQSPSYYTPYLPNGDIKDSESLEPGIKRMNYVLKRMRHVGFITEKEYTEAVGYDVAKDFQKKSNLPKEKYPNLVYEAEDRARDILIEQFAKEDKLSLNDLAKDKDLYNKYYERADIALRQDGYRIHTTIDKKMYNGLQEVAANFKDYGPDKPQVNKDATTGKEQTVNESVELGSIAIENKTGRILSFVPSRGFSSENELNYATGTKRPNGSTMKPLLDYAPAMEKGYIQPGSVIADVPKSFNGWKPGNYAGGTHGLVSAREALRNSYNIPAAEIYVNMLNKGEDPAKEYLEKMGITSLTKEDHQNASLSLGQPTYGITVEENTNAFATFANGGDFVDAYMIEKIEDDNGKVIYQHKAKPVNVFSPQTSYLTIDMMRDVINSGTGAYAKSQLKYSGVDWAGKTGTSQNWEDAWFVASNPNVTVGTWIGYKTPKSLLCTNCNLTYSQRNIKIWSQLVNKASELDPDLMAPKERFKQPEGIVSRSYCGVSGMLPSDACSKAGLVRSDIFNAKFVPSKTDDSLVNGGNTVMIHGKAVAAGPKTPKEFTTGKGLGFNPEFLKRKGYDKLSDISVLYPRTNTDSWKKIGIAGGSAAKSNIKDDGKSPAAPTSLKVSSSTLTWGKSSSNDVVGYRIFQASGDGYRLIGHTTSNSYKVSDGNAGFIVKAVDYFGRESSASNALKPTSKAKDDNKAEEQKKADDSKKQEEQKDKQKTEKKEQEEAKKKAEAEKKKKAEEAKKQQEEQKKKEEQKKQE